MESRGEHGIVLGPGLMQRWIVVASLVLSACVPPRARSSIVGEDKVKHFFIAGFVESMAFAGSQAAGAGHSTARTIGLGTVTGVSIGRELYDRRAKGTFSFADLAWDALGAGAALLVVNKTQR